MTDDDPPTDPGESSTTDAPDPDESPSGPAAAADAVGAPGGGGPDASLGEVFFADLQRKLTLGAVAILAILAAFAIYRTYAAASRAIAIWVSRDYVPIFAAVFNVIVFLVAVAGIFYLVRRVS